MAGFWPVYSGTRVTLEPGSMPCVQHAHGMVVVAAAAAAAAAEVAVEGLEPCIISERMGKQ